MDQKSIQNESEIQSIKIETEVSEVTIPAEQLHSAEVVEGELVIKTTKSHPFHAEI